MVMMKVEEIENELGLKLNELMYHISPFYLRSENMCGIYYLINEAYEILYIGQSRNLERRIRSHCCNIHKENHWMKEVKYTTCKFCEEGLLLKIEREEILKYKPKYNTVWYKEKVTVEIMDVNVDLVRRERLAGTTWKQLETDLKVSTTLMISRLKKAGFWDFERRMVK